MGVKWPRHSIVVLRERVALVLAPWLYVPHREIQRHRDAMSEVLDPCASCDCTDECKDLSR